MPLISSYWWLSCFNRYNNLFFYSLVKGKLKHLSPHPGQWFQATQLLFCLGTHFGVRSALYSLLCFNTLRVYETVKTEYFLRMDYLPVEVLDCFFSSNRNCLFCLFGYIGLFLVLICLPCIFFCKHIVCCKGYFFLFIVFDLRFVRGVLWMLECQSRNKVFISFFFLHVFISIILLNFFFNVIFCFSRASEDRVELGRLAAVILQCVTVCGVCGYNFPLVCVMVALVWI